MRNNFMVRKLLRLPAVMELTGLSRSAIYDGMEKGEFTQNINITEHAVAWVESEVAEWIEARIAKRDEAAKARIERDEAAKVGGDAPRVRPKPSITAGKDPPRRGRPPKRRLAGSQEAA
jgi:prophage regulatory protein